MERVNGTDLYFKLMHKINRYQVTPQSGYIYNDCMSHIYQNGSCSTVLVPFVPHFWLTKHIPYLRYICFYLKNKQTIQLKLWEKFPS